MQDFTGAPAIIRPCFYKRCNKILRDSPDEINPIISVDLVIEYSVQVDSYGLYDSLPKTLQKKWRQKVQAFPKHCYLLSSEAEIFSPKDKLLYSAIG